MHRDHCLMVLGMHRSGTSALTGVLRQSGLYLGAALDSAIPLNPTGLQEAPSVLHMHEDLLNANGGCWHAPPDRVTWGKLHCAVRDLFIESRIGTGLWGFKDPRTLLVIDGWIEVLPRWSAIGIFRAPQAVTRSLMARNGLEEAACHRLWHAYNSRLLRLHRLYDIPLIAFRSDAQCDPGRYRPGPDRYGADPGHRAAGRGHSQPRQRGGRGQRSGRPVGALAGFAGRGPCRGMSGSIPR
ncbi:hypothetical protein [Ponticoccus litoralis]|uniref:Sulfotransferase family protein n=1 Tax=Ponticoccus litoralis TaxID=422297 RepID=A0AAW9SFY4_9RHOB